MLSKLATAGAVAAVIVGAGTTALAVSGEPASTAGYAAQSGQQTSSNGTITDKTTKNKHKNGRAALRKVLAHVQHAEVVTKGKDGFVEHDAIRGQVTTVSASSISVKAADGFSTSFVIDKSTHVRKRPAGHSAGNGGGGAKTKPTPGKIADVKTGDQVVVVGKHAASASGQPTATMIIDGVSKK